MQPDIHYDGPITLEYTTDLIAKLNSAIQHIKSCDFPDLTWIVCKQDWIQTVQEALVRCDVIKLKIKENFNLSESDRKCIDISLCILRDFHLASSTDFLHESQS